MKADSVEYSGGDLCGFRYPILLNPWFLMAAAVFLGVLLSFTTVYLDDESIWGYCGWLWSAHGEPPYLRSFENKAGRHLLVVLAFQHVVCRDGLARKVSCVGGAGRDPIHAL